jgi:glycosyltransferase involved in cell wall biosynthesis
MLVGVDASRVAVAQRTGTEAYSLHLIRSLLATGRSHRFRLYLKDALMAGTLPDVPHCEQRVMPFPRLWTHVRLSTEMLVHPPDVLFVPSHVLPIVHPRKSVVTVHDLGHRAYPGAHTPQQRRYLEWSTRYHVRQAAHLIADSRATADDLVRFYDADQARITVAHLGVDPNLGPVHDAERIALVLERYGVTAPYLLYVGTVQPRKNLARLVDAFARLLQADAVASDLQLVLAGKRGWLSEGIMARVREVGLESQVVFTGYVREEDLAALYSGAALFVMPSLYEGFCLPVLEAMAVGTPVVSSSASSLPEVAGDAALFFDPADVDAMASAMSRGLMDKGLRQELVTCGCERVKNYTWERCARQVLSVLEAVGSADIP